MGISRIICYVLVAVLIGACTFDREPIDEGSPQALNGPDRESWDVHMIISRVPSLSADSYPRLAITAPYVEHYDTADSVHQVLSGGEVRFVVYNLHGDTTAVVTAASAIYYEREQRFRAIGNVDVQTANGTQLKTESLSWSEAEAKLTTNAYVSITTSREYLEGQGIVADEDMSSYQIGRFTARLETDS